MLPSIKNYFHYTRSERNGLLILIGLLLFLLGLSPLYSSLKGVEQTNFNAYEAEIIAFQQNLERPPLPSHSVPKSNQKLKAQKIDMNTASKNEWLALGFSPKQVQTILNYQKSGGYFSKPSDLIKIYGIDSLDYKAVQSYLTVAPDPIKSDPKSYTAESKPTPLELVFFDPNTADKTTLLQIGLPAKTAQIMINYRKKGGTFRKKEDLLKIFGMTDQLYQRIEPYLLITAPEPKIEIDSSQQAIAALAPVPPEPDPVPVEKIRIDINQASIAEWEALPGIGAYYAKQIVRFREHLGGFSHIGQIAETYNLNDSTFQQIKAQLYFSPIFRKIPINTCTIEPLQAHPYLKRRQAKVILRYRERHGPFQSVEDLKHILALDEELIEKIGPYLSFE